MFYFFYFPGQIFSTKNNTLSSTSLDTLLLSYSSTAIDLSMLGINGTIPKEIAFLTQLEYIDLCKDIVFEIQSLYLRNILHKRLSDASYNYLIFSRYFKAHNHFNGNFPFELLLLNNLKYLNLCKL